MLSNIKKGIITTIIGSLFLAASLFYFVYSIFNNIEADSVLLIVSSTIGLGLLVAPDDLFKRLKSKL